MTRRTTRRLRARVDRLMPVHARMHRDALSEDFTRRTMAAVRCANARAGQQAPTAPRHLGATRAALALACLTITAALAASLTFQRGPSMRTTGVRQSPDRVTSSISLPTFELHATRTSTFQHTLVEPIRNEAEALIDTGRDVGVAMLSTLPVRPQSWTDRLNEHANR